MPVTNTVLLGTTRLKIRQLLDLNPGDVLTLNRNQTDPLNMLIEATHKFNVSPMEKAGHLAARVHSNVEIREPPSLGDEAIKLADLVKMNNMAHIMLTLSSEGGRW